MFNPVTTCPACQSFADTINGILSDIDSLQEDLKTATDPEKPGILKQISDDRKQLGEPRRELAQCELQNGCVAVPLAVLALQVTAITGDGKLWHTTRFADGSWQPSFDDVKAQESNDPGLFYEDIACAAAFGNLHVCGITTGDGKLWHTIRFADGSWQPSFGDVDAQVPSVPGAFFGVGCSVNVLRDLHVITITSGDPTANPANIYHTIRHHADGSWQPFVDVKAQESNDPGTFIGISCAAASGDLHVVGTTGDGKLWHTIRFADGSWQPFFGDVKAQESNDPGLFIAVSVASRVNFTA